MSTLIMRDKNLILMNALLMDSITQLKEWQDTQMNDPRIVDAENRWSAALEKAKTVISEELYMELIDSYGAAISATGDIGILFSIRVADAIRCQRQFENVGFRRTGNVEKWRVNVYSL